LQILNINLFFLAFYPVDLFNQTTDLTDITPDTWAFAIWAVIYIFQVRKKILKRFISFNYIIYLFYKGHNTWLWPELFPS